MKQMNWIDAGKRIGLGALGAIGAAALICGLLAMLVSGELLPLTAGVTAAPVCFGLCLFGACFLTARSVPQSRLPVSLAVAALAVLLCLFGKAICFPSDPLLWDWRFAIPWAASAAAGLLASRKKTRRR